MSQVSRLRLQESAKVDEDELARLYIKLDYGQAERLITEAVDDLSRGLGQAEQAFLSGNERAMMASCRKTARAAQRLGMRKLASVARDVRIACHQQDETAAYATLARLLRLGEPSLRELWNIKAMQS